MIRSRFCAGSTARNAGNPIARQAESMREYELTVVFDLAVAEADGADASVNQLKQAIESRGGKVLKVDHWGRRRMAYPIKNAIDGDYVVTRVELDPAEIGGLEAAFRINERVYRHLVVRADELPAPPPPREPRHEPAVAAPAEARSAPVATAEAPAAAAEPAPAAVSPEAGASPPSGEESPEE